MRTVVDVATPRKPIVSCAPRPRSSASACWPRWLGPPPPGPAPPLLSPSCSEHDSRYVRFNDERRTFSGQLPKEDYALTKACVDAFAAGVSSEEENAAGASGEEKTPLDQRRCDGFMVMIHSVTPGDGTTTTSPTTSTSTADTAPRRPPPHPPPPNRSSWWPMCPWPTWSTTSTGDKSELAGELEHHGLIDLETVQRIACDATVVVAVDDAARPHHVRGPGPTLSFRSPKTRGDPPGSTVPVPGVCQRHLRRRAPRQTVGTRRRADLDIGVLPLREHHHGAVWKGWSMTGNPNEELTIVGARGPGHGVAPFSALDQGDGCSHTAEWLALSSRSNHLRRRGFDPKDSSGAAQLCGRPLTSRAWAMSCKRD